jgi:hypothetical protein
MRWIIAAMIFTLGMAPGCDDRSYREIGAAIDVLTKKTDGMSGPAIERLQKIGRRSIPQIEIALHTAAPNSRTNLLAALDAIGDPDAAAILRHFGSYDPNTSVRLACEEILKRWSLAGDRRSAPARAALQKIAENRKHLAEE